MVQANIQCLEHGQIVGYVNMLCVRQGSALQLLVTIRS